MGFWVGWFFVFLDDVLLGESLVGGVRDKSGGRHGGVVGDGHSDMLRCCMQMFVEDIAGSGNLRSASEAGRPLDAGLEKSTKSGGHDSRLWYMLIRSNHNLQTQHKNRIAYLNE